MGTNEENALGIKSMDAESAPLLRPRYRLNTMHSESQPEAEAGSGQRTLGMFSGVFCPVALSMFSTLLFLRDGFVIGQSGLLYTLLELLLAYSILLLTVLSICAISTNGAVEGGGAYYMISRALGPEFGGSIGFLFYVANVVACALYVTGFVETVIDNFGVHGNNTLIDGEGLPMDAEVSSAGVKGWTYLYATIVLFVCLLVCIIGGSMFAKTCGFILLITVVCIIMVFASVFFKDPIEGKFTGLREKTFRENLYDNYTRYPDTKHERVTGFPPMFALVFSSVTGIMNGANMSGELKNPSKSIPKGTLLAVLFTSLVYTVESVLVAGSCERHFLQTEYIFLQEINIWPYFVLIGIFATSLSAALGNLIGASRILQALANDQLFWFVLKPATITTKGGNPYMAVLISWFLVQCVLLVGSLNAIAPVASVFFLLSYASTNLACMALDLASAPNFRPQFKYFSWHLSFLGLIGSVVMCFFVDAIYSSVGIILMLLLIILLHFRSLPTQWGSISQALIFHQVRKYLLMLDIRKAHVKYWRPQILLMVANPRQSCELMNFVNDIKKGGLYVIGHVKKGHLDDFDADPLTEENSKWLSLVDYLKIKAFAEVTLRQDVRDGFHTLIQLSGLGGMKINTVCLGFYDNEPPGDSLSKEIIRRREHDGWSEDFENVSHLFPAIRKPDGSRHLDATVYVQMIKDALKMNRNVLLCRHLTKLDKQSLLASKGVQYIDIWPVNFFRLEALSYGDVTSEFLLQLACILHMVPGWKSKTVLRVFLVVKDSTQNNRTEKLQKVLDQLRIEARIEPVFLDTVAWDTQERMFASMTYASAKMHEFKSASTSDLSAINRWILEKCKRTVVSFLYLPQPPTEASDYSEYLDQLDALSVNLPPTVFVHGLHTVTSTTL